MCEHKLVSVNGKVYAVCSECWRAAGEIEEERAESIEPLAENCLASQSDAEYSCIYCGHEIVSREPEWCEDPDDFGEMKFQERFSL